MYCQYCAAPLEERALTCARCGHAVGAAPPPPQYPYPPPYPPPYQYHPYPQPAGMNIFAVLGFIFTLVPFVPLVGFILCIAGYSGCKKTGQPGRGLALAGIVINAVGYALLIAGIAAFVVLANSGHELLREWSEEYSYIVFTLL